MELNFNNSMQSFYDRFETICVIVIAIIEIITCQKRNQHHKLYPVSLLAFTYATGENFVISNYFFKTIFHRVIIFFYCAIFYSPAITLEDKVVSSYRFSLNYILFYLKFTVQISSNR